MKSKALFLLFVFLLNTAVGFSCALHMSPDHEHEEEHNHGKNHKESQHHAHHHQSATIKANISSKVSIIEKNAPCCQGAVNNFISTAKILPQAVKADFTSPVALIKVTHIFSFKALSTAILNQRVAINQRQRPPTSDIRVSIQSFQI